MTRKRERKIKKLRKARIWPSIVFLVFSFGMLLSAFVIFLGMMLKNHINEQNVAAITNAFLLINNLDTFAGREEEAIRNMEGNGIIPDAVLIYDRNKNLIAGHGEATYIGDVFGEQGESNSDMVVVKLSDDGSTQFNFYLDRDSDFNFLDENGNINDYALIQNADKIKNIAEGNKESGLLNMKFWIGANISGGRRALVKCNVGIDMADVGEAFLIASSMAILLALPVIFLFINLLLSFSNQRRMTKLIYTDPVTGGGKSNLYFENNADKILKKKNNAILAVVDLTIMKYRSYRNFHGIKNAEALLEEVNIELEKNLKKKEICAHSGKSSFVLLMKGTSRKEIKERLNTLLNNLSGKFTQCGIVFHAGVYFYEFDKADIKNEDLAADCLSRASAARATLPDENVNALAIYEDNILEEQKWVHKVEEKMQSALDKGEFKVFIQPKYNPVTEELAGGEALIRWVNEEDGFISPGRFIPIFESNGFITKIDDFMISNVAKLHAEWIKEGKNVVPISVNVSRAHFANPLLAEHICSLVDAYSVPHNLIELELTESAFFDDKAALLRTVHKLQDMGFEISMDDFGAGYSSLNSLKDLPLDVLKLDAEFFRGEDGENRMEIVVSQAIKLAKSLDMRIVAEGVEKKEQVDFLAGQGCDMIQGFYYAKPMPANEYAERFKEDDLPAENSQEINKE